MKSGQIWAAGVQDLSKHLAATAQASFDESISTFKALTCVKSLKDAMDLQTAFARATLEKTLAESGKLTDASIKLTEQALAPITARVTRCGREVRQGGLIRRGPAWTSGDVDPRSGALGMTR